MDPKIPPNDYFEYYGPDYNLLFPERTDEKDYNSKEYLEFVQIHALSHLKSLEHAPNAGTREYVVKDFFDHEQIENRQTQRAAHH